MSLISGIFGVMPPEVLAQQKAERQERLQAAVAQAQTPVQKGVTGFVTSATQGLTQGVLQGLGIESDEMKQAKRNKAEADKFAKDYVNARTPEQVEAMVVELISRGAPESVINTFMNRAKDLAPVQPEAVSEKKIEMYTSNIDEDLKEVAGFDLTSLSANDINRYKIRVMEDLEKNKAKIKTLIKNRSRDPNGKLYTMPSDSDQIRSIIRDHSQKGVLTSKDSFIFWTDGEYNAPDRDMSEYIDTATGLPYSVTPSENKG
jgi:nitrogen regulatory protein PII-like uncharacterized protein